MRPNHLWHLDFVQRYIGKVSTFTLILIDDCSRYVVGHGVDDAERADMVVSTFEEATERHGRPERVMHDKGSAFWSWRGISRFTGLLTEMGIDVVVAEHKEWNGKVEVFNANLHKELFDAHRFYDVAEMRRRLEAHLHWYNHAAHAPRAGRAAGAGRPLLRSRRLPYELRRLAAFKADVLTALARIFVEAVFARYRSRAGCDGIESPQCGSVNFVQRFGSLNLHVHFHLLALDGVFARDARGGLVFHPAEAPTAADLEAIVARTARRSIAWLRKRGYIDDSPLEARSNEEPAQTALDACAAIAMGRGNVSTLPRDGTQDDGHGAAEERPDKPALAVERDGFNVHAGVRIEAGDDLGRERLARYGARPPLSLERLRRLPGGRVAYRLKYVDRGRRGKIRRECLLRAAPGGARWYQSRASNALPAKPRVRRSLVRPNAAPSNTRRAMRAVGLRRERRRRQRRATLTAGPPCRRTMSRWSLRCARRPSPTTS